VTGGGEDLRIFLNGSRFQTSPSWPKRPKTNWRAEFSWSEKGGARHLPGAAHGSEDEPAQGDRRVSAPSCAGASCAGIPAIAAPEQSKIQAVPSCPVPRACSRGMAQRHDAKAGDPRDQPRNRRIDALMRI
jgi:hypothetical protein